MSARDKSDAEVSPMEAQNTAQRHKGPADPKLAGAGSGQGAGPDKTDGTQTSRPSPIETGGEAEVRDDR